MYNIDPKFWGKHFWATAHYITLSYPNNPTNEEKQSVKDFFEVLKVLLPCAKCRSHYSNNLQINPLTDNILNSKYKLIEWLVNLHNEVNGRTGKKQITVEDAINLYTNPNNHNSFDYTLFFTIVLLIMLVCTLIYYVRNY